MRCITGLLINMTNVKKVFRSNLKIYFTFFRVIMTNLMTKNWIAELNPVLFQQGRKFNRPEIKESVPFSRSIWYFWSLYKKLKILIHAISVMAYNRIVEYFPQLFSPYFLSTYTGTPMPVHYFYCISV